MNISTRRPAPAAATSPRSRRGRLASTLLVLAFALVAVLAPAGTANAAVRLGNGAYADYGLDCGYRSAKLTVQAGANGVGINGFKYWVYSVDFGVYLLNGKWVPAASTGWSATTIPITTAPGRYMIYVEYYSYTGGRWYTGGEWTWARNFVQPTSSQICIVI